MKLYVCICVVVFFSPVKGNQDEDAERLFGDEVKKGAQVCLKQFQVEEEDFGALTRFECPKSDNGKCFMKCMLQNVELVKEEKYCGDGFLAKVKGWLSHNPEKYGKVEKMVNNCKPVVESEYTFSEDDKCGISTSVMKCFQNHEEETAKLREILAKIAKED